MVGDDGMATINRNNAGMQTLGAKNEFIRNNRQRSTLDTKRPSKGPAPNPPQHQLQQTYGIQNPSYKNDSEDEEMSIGINHHGRSINLSTYGNNNTTSRKGANGPRKNRDSEL